MFQKLFKILSFNISGNVRLFQVPVFPNKSGNQHFTVFISGYFPVFQSLATWGYIFGYMDFEGWPEASLVGKRFNTPRKKFLML